MNAEHTIHPHSTGRSPRQKRGVRRRRRGFSLTELLVVIGIIVVLIGLLLVALAQVQKKAKRTRTESLMQQFANACAAFQTEHGIYPGVIPDDVLLAHEQTNGTSPISSTENALLHLVGGYRVVSPQEDVAGSAALNEFNQYPVGTGQILTFGTSPNQWRLKINPARIGEGPYINGKPYAPYFTPGPDDLVALRPSDPNNANSGQIGEPAAGFLPDLVDAWGQPILYLRQARTSGPIVFDTTADAPRPQFLLAGLRGFLNSTGAGEAGADQSQLSIFGDFDNGNGGWDVQQRKFFSVILGHEAFYQINSAGTTAPLYGQARGAFLLLSAGADGIYFSRTDGPRPTPPTNPIDTSNIDQLIIDVGPRVLDDVSTGFDDIRVYGGG